MLFQLVWLTFRLNMVMSRFHLGVTGYWLGWLGAQTPSSIFETSWPMFQVFISVGYFQFLSAWTKTGQHRCHWGTLPTGSIWCGAVLSSSSWSEHSTRHIGRHSKLGHQFRDSQIAKTPKMFSLIWRQVLHLHKCNGVSSCLKLSAEVLATHRTVAPKCLVCQGSDCPLSSCTCRRLRWVVQQPFPTWGSRPCENRSYPNHFRGQGEPPLL